MPQTILCPRCHTPIVHEDDGALLYCFHCGAPQIRLSEELRTAAEQMALHAGNPDAADPTATQPIPAAFAPGSAGNVPWKSAIRAAALFSAVFVLFVLILPPLALFVAPAALSLFAARHRDVRITTSIGTRVGLLCGFFCIAGAALLESVALLTLRLSGHGADGIDPTVNELLTRLKTQAFAPAGQDAVERFTSLIGIHEFRVGIIFGFFAIGSVTLMLFAVTGGSAAGYLRARLRAR